MISLKVKKDESNINFIAKRNSLRGMSQFGEILLHLEETLSIIKSVGTLVKTHYHICAEDGPKIASKRSQTFLCNLFLLICLYNK